MKQTIQDKIVAILNDREHRHVGLSNAGLAANLGGANVGSVRDATSKLLRKGVITNVGTQHQSCYVLVKREPFTKQCVIPQFKVLEDLLYQAIQTWDDIQREYYEKARSDTRQRADVGELSAGSGGEPAQVPDAG